MAEVAANRIRSPEFRWLAGAQAVSMVGNTMTNTALFWLAIRLSHGHALGLAAVSTAQFLPMLVLSRWAGLLAVRHPALAGFLIELTGTGPVFLADAVSFCGVVAVLVWLARVVQPAAGRDEDEPAPARRFRWVLDLPRGVLLAAIAALLIGGFGYQFEITNPLMATRVFHLGAAQFGVLGTLMAVGGIAGSYYSAHRPGRPRRSEFAVWSLVFGISAGTAALMPVPWAYAATMILVGATITLFAITATVYIRQETPSSQLGPALSAYNAAYIGFVPAGAFCVAAIAALAGVRWAILAPAIAVTIAALAILALGPEPAAAQHPGTAPASPSWPASPS